MIHLQYLRKSRDRREREDPDVLRRHRAILLEVAQRDEVTIPAEHIFEEVKSGESIAARPEFRRLLALIEALPDCSREQVGGVLYCIDADRLARGILTERGELQELLARKGILIREVGPTLDLRNPDQRLLHNVKGALAEWELGKYKERVERTRTLQLQQGQLRNGRVPFGYKHNFETKQPEPHPEKFSILQACCGEAFHTSLEALARKYQVPLHRLLRALQSPMICGYPAKVTETVKNAKGVTLTRRIPRERWVWPTQPGSYPIAMERGEWERLQVVLAARKWGKGRSKRSDGWRRDVVQFPQMPGRVRLGTYQSATAKFPVYQRRPDRHGRGPYLYVKRDAVHSRVLETLRPVLESPVFLQLLAAIEQEQPPAIGRSEAALKHEQARLMEQLKALDRMESDPETHPARLPGLRDLRNEAISRIDAIRRELERSRAQAPSLSAAEAKWLGELDGFLKEGFEESWDLLTDEDRRGLVNALVEAVAVTVVPRKGAHERQIEVRLSGWVRGIEKAGG